MSAFEGTRGPEVDGALDEDEVAGENDNELAFELLAYVPGRLKEGSGD
jgi:hypothetical protein